ncbi:MAG: toxin-antitoxin system YwqK family antitoxin [Alphaproteobacteria bacterium]|nr:toxin-antitoxin system YwqK family antitoxin [Alphaproteobacteria bacterium]
MKFFLILITSLSLLTGCGENSNKQPVVQADGEHTEYYPDGKTLYKKYNIKNGKADGTVTMYFMDGKINLVQEYKDGKREGKTIVYYPNGNLNLSTHFQEDLQHGKMLLYYETGELEAKGTFNMGTSEVEAYDKKGRLEHTEYYEDGEKEGTWYYYYKNGKLKESCLYRNDVLKGCL